MKTSNRRLAALLAGGSMLVMASMADAQTASRDVEEVVVTGSRVIQNGDNSPNPVTVVTMEDMQASKPTTVFEALSELPVFSARSGALNQPSGASGSNASGNTLDLRGRGAGRTLILYDGHRVPPTNQDGGVDVSMIPQMLLQRVDVVTGGVSAVYGSDAITGVVNFITDRKFVGIKTQVQGGVTQEGDDKSYEVGVAGGKNLFGGRGHIEGSYQVHYDDGLQRNQRPYLDEYSMQGSGTTALPYFLTRDVRIGAYTFGGKIIGPANNPLNNYDFRTNGVATPFVNGSTVGVAAGLNQIGGNGVRQQTTSLKAQQDFSQAYGRFDFDVTDNLHFFLVGTATKVHSFNYNTNTRIASFTVSATNPYLAPAYQTQLAAAKITSFTVGKMWDASVLTPQTVDFNTRHNFINTGFEGSWGDYKWEVSATHSIAKLNSTGNGSVNAGNFYASLDSVVNPANGQIVCNVSLTNPGLYPGCVPLNIFGPTAESKEALDYINDPTHYHGQTVMDDAAGSIAGSPFSTWAGPVNMAVSGEYRKLEYELHGDSPPVNVDPLPCTGLRFNCATGANVRFIPNAVADRTPVQMKVAEAAFEVDVPVLKDWAFIESANINGGVRYAAYEVVGSPIAGTASETKNFNATIWKLGLDLHINEMLTFRATRSRDFRAPNLNDLFAPGSLNILPNNDLLTNQSVRVNIQTGGNPKLKPEIGKTTTAGFVLRPYTGLSLAIDAFHIDITDAITNAAGTNATFQQACYESKGASFYCTLQERPLGYTNTSAANAVTKWYTIPINLSRSLSYGADFEVNYKTEILDRALSLRALATWVPHTVNSQPASPQTDNAGLTTPNVKITLYAKLAVTEAFSVDVSTRIRSRIYNFDQSRFVGPVDLALIDPSAFTNLNLSYRIDTERLGQANFFLNIQNLFNKRPAFAPASGEPGLSGGFAGGDDPIGRAFSFGVRTRY